jgi:S-adenosylmethionine:tRNA ribosyltransferase-isomerase
MELKEFSYNLPEELIAQHPCDKRDQSRMMVLERRQNKIDDLHFFQLPDFLSTGDVLVINDSRVIPARLFGSKATGAIVEVLLLTKKEGNAEVQTWEVLLRPAKRLRVGDVITLGGECKAKVFARISEKKWLLQFTCAGNFDEYVQSFGRAPLPPYIKRKKSNQESFADRERYQTIYARNPGSIAAPTAGLHFSPEVMQMLSDNGVLFASITLHVGFGTFLPIEAQQIENHIMESEHYEISPHSAKIINNAKRVIAVGTTSTRVLESVADENGTIYPQSGQTNLFIYPGYKFKRIDGLLTNFHLPESSLFLLASAFAGMDFIKRAYGQAIANRYHFYSYGDCMLIL